MAVLVCMVAAALSFSGGASAYDGSSPSLSANVTSVAAGGTVDLTGTGFSDSSTADLSFHSTVVDLGSVDTDASGDFSVTVKIPTNAVAGEHHIEAEDGDTSAVASVEITVSAASGTATSTSTPGDTGVAVVGLATVGGVLLIGGALMLMAGRRRKVIA